MFHDCRIPRDHLLGGQEEVPQADTGSYRSAMQTFNMTRPMVAMGALGIARAALEFTRDTLHRDGVTLT